MTSLPLTAFHPASNGSPSQLDEPARRRELLDTCVLPDTYGTLGGRILRRILLPLAVISFSGSPAPVADAGYPAGLLGPGVIATRDYERDGSFAPDGRAFYFTKRTIWPYFSAICVSHLDHGRWSAPGVASFSGRWPDATPFVAPDGSALYFASRRPMPNGAAGYHLWVVDRTPNGWSEPRPLPDVVNSAGNAFSPAVTSGGTLYFIGEQGHVLRAARDGATWSAPVALANDTGSATADVSVYVTPDERSMIVSILGRDDALHSVEAVYPRSDLYLRDMVDGVWGPPRHLPAPINSAANEGGQATLTPDRRHLVFTSERGVFTEHGRPLDFGTLERELHSTGNGLGDIYQIDARALGLTDGGR